MRQAAGNWQVWILVLIGGGVIAAGVWAFEQEKPPRWIDLEIGVRHIEDQRAEIAVRETDHLGIEHFYEIRRAEVDYSLENRPRSLYSEPISLSNDRRNQPSKARITIRGWDDDDIRLGVRLVRPNGKWGGTRFPRNGPVTIEEVQSPEWSWLPPLAVNVLYHQPLVTGVRLLVYIAGGLVILCGSCWLVWRFVLNR